MRNFIIVITSLWMSLAHAQDWEDRRVFTTDQATQNLRILSSTDTAYLTPMIDAFMAVNQGVEIEYLVTGTTDIYDIMRKNPNGYDLVISSAMDLQIKLVNDGYSRRQDTLGYPDWAHWRNSLFGFTAEPAAIILNKATFAERDLPQSRQDLIQALRDSPEAFKGRIGTYDIRKSGLGYLFATQDAKTSETYWRLTEIMGGLDTQLYCCSGAMIDDVADGTLAVAYNVLGSYAMGRTDIRDQIEVIFPSDFSTTMMRSIFVSKTAPEPMVAEQFLAFMLNYFTSALDGHQNLPPLITQANNMPRQIIPLEPSLMIYLDRLKQRSFVAEWENALVR